MSIPGKKECSLAKWSLGIGTAQGIMLEGYTVIYHNLAVDDSFELATQTENIPPPEQSRMGTRKDAIVVTVLPNHVKY